MIGDLMHEEAILEWVLDLHESEPDFIESVDRKTLQTLINDVEHLAVFFCKYKIYKILIRKYHFGSKNIFILLLIINNYY